MRVLHCSLFLLLLLLTEAKHQPDRLKRARKSSVPASGEVTTMEGHECVWQTSGEVLVKLQVNCSTQTSGNLQHRYWCLYAGKPDLCQVYVLKSSHYWKQLLSKLKKRQNVCQGDKVLKVKWCKKASAEAHMKLIHRSDDVQRILASKPRLTRRRKKTEEEEEKKKRRTEFEEEDIMKDMQQEESYCNDKWKSVCSFFLKLFEGNSISQIDVKSNSK